MAQRPRELQPELSPRHLLGAKLRELRNRRGLSQAKLAAQVFCSAPLVAQIEKAQRTASFDLANRLDTALGGNGELVTWWIAAQADRRQVATIPSAPEISHESGGAAARVASSNDLRVTVDIDGKKVHMSLNRRAVLHGGAAFLANALGLGGSGDRLFVREHSRAVHSRRSMPEIVDQLQAQWHDLVRIDNVAGPPVALPVVRNQIAFVEGLLQSSRGSLRNDLVYIGAQYAESAAWLYEELGDIRSSEWWVGRATEWAYEAGDEAMLAWTMFRRSQQANAAGDSGKARGLVTAIRRGGAVLPGPMQAALQVQEAIGLAIDLEVTTALHLLDKAHELALPDSNADARSGHGSFCTPGYVEVARGHCLIIAGRHSEAMNQLELAIPAIPNTYARDRLAAQSRLAATYVELGYLEEAASLVRELSPQASQTGSVRIVRRIERVATSLAKAGGSQYMTLLGTT